MATLDESGLQRRRASGSRHGHRNSNRSSWMRIAAACVVGGVALASWTSIGSRSSVLNGLSQGWIPAVSAEILEPLSTKIQRLANEDSDSARRMRPRQVATDLPGGPSNGSTTSTTASATLTRTATKSSTTKSHTTSTMSKSRTKRSTATRKAVATVVVIDPAATATRPTTTTKTTTTTAPPPTTETTAAAAGESTPTLVLPEPGNTDPTVPSATVNGGDATDLTPGPTTADTGSSPTADPATPTDGTTTAPTDIASVLELCNQVFGLDTPLDMTCGDACAFFYVAADKITACETTCTAAYPASIGDSCDGFVNKVIKAQTSLPDGLSTDAATTDSGTAATTDAAAETEATDLATPTETIAADPTVDPNATDPTMPDATEIPTFSLSVPAEATVVTTKKKVKATTRRKTISVAVPTSSDATVLPEETTTLSEAGAEPTEAPTTTSTKSAANHLQQITGSKSTTSTTRPNPLAGQPGGLVDQIGAASPARVVCSFGLGVVVAAVVAIVAI